MGGLSASLQHGVSHIMKTATGSGDKKPKRHKTKFGESNKPLNKMWYEDIDEDKSL